jgi:MFS transporter, UMF1 family
MKFFPNKVVKHWAYYDFANSSYVLIFQSFLVPMLFSTLLIKQGFDKLSWGLANGLSTLLGVILAVVIGRFADMGDRLRTFKFIVFISFILMMLFSVSVGYFQYLSFHLFVITNAIFIASIAISDSLLTFISKRETKNEYSGTAWGFGYVGGILCLIIVMIIQKFSSEYSPLVFGFVALFYFGFSLYAFKGLDSSASLIDYNSKDELPVERKIKIPDLLKLLTGYWLIAEAITVYILFYAYYANEEVKMSSFEVSFSLILLQTVAIFSTWIGGKLADKHSTLKLLGFSILIWVIIVSLMVTLPYKPVVYFVVVLTGLVIGNSQSYLRAQFSSVVDKKTAGQNFGYYAIASQASVIVGPIIHGYLSDSFHSQKIPLFLLCLTMIIGFILIRNVTKHYKLV